MDKSFIFDNIHMTKGNTPEFHTKNWVSKSHHTRVINNINSVICPLS